MVCIEYYRIVNLEYPGLQRMLFNNNMARITHSKISSISSNRDRYCMMIINRLLKEML